jgi:aryl-alcohol dehydrogenase-like predicted oxidoreductase
VLVRVGTTSVVNTAAMKAVEEFFKGEWAEEDLDKVEALISWASAHGRSLLEVAVGSLLARPGCGCVLAGATSATQVKANAQAAEWIPTEADLAEIDAITPA